MREGMSFGQSDDNSASKKEYLQGLGGISAELEEVFQNSLMGETLQRPEFADAAALVSDFRDIVKHADGSPLTISEAVRDLRIIAKEHGWNGDIWDWDVIRKEATKMNYEVRPQKMREDMEREGI